MKYIVKLTKEVERYVVVNAANLEEADKKLLSDDIEKEFVRTKSNHAYGDWGYSGDDEDCVEVAEGDCVITSPDDFAMWFSGRDASHLERDLFKYTDCGMCATWDDEKINLCGYVEGSECDWMPNETLYFPFTGSKAKKVMDDLEKEADVEWHRWNDERYTYYITDVEDPMEFYHAPGRVIDWGKDKDETMKKAEEQMRERKCDVYVHMWDEVDLELVGINEDDYVETYTIKYDEEESEI